tara:strand:+ start:780 stop:1763 length:984 start_codon:yes stop_codon:yes gene_type:complete
MLDRWHKKEKPIFTGITRGVGGFGFGAAVDGGGGAGGFQASGGTKITSGDYTIHHFPCPSRTVNATDNFIITGSGTVDVCVIGAGGGGASGDPGAFSGGGGGAGAVVIKLNQPVTAQSYPIVTGHGSDRVDTGANQSGSDSTALGLTGAGGGRGGATGGIGAAGGSAGGPSHAAPGVIAGTGVPYPGSGPLESPPAGWGNDSGDGSADYNGGGGGGAGGAGSNRTGGAGLDLSPLFGTSLGVSGVFAGGGGAGAYSGPAGSGGSGGGGNSGQSGAGNGDGIAGTLNTGAGGGGSDGSASGAVAPFGGGGGGAPGIVIIRYLTSQIGT